MKWHSPGRQKLTTVGRFRGRANQFQNQAVQGSASFICAITSSGDYYVHKVEGANNSKIFIRFLTKLRWWLRSKIHANMAKTLLILDNWAIHTAIRVKNKLNKLGGITVFLPPYSPEFQPIELFFGLVKKRFLRSIGPYVVNLNDDREVHYLIDAFTSVSRSEIISMFSRCLKTSKLHFSKM